MTTAQEIFDAAMGLIDEVNETTGATDTSDTREYKLRTLLILNSLRGELYPYSDNFAGTEAGRRPICPVIKDFESPVELDDYICQTVLPYGLAAHLLLDENPGSASFFQQRYEELRRSLASGLLAVSEDIEDIYGSCGGLGDYGDFGMWG